MRIGIINHAVTALALGLAAGLFLPSTAAADFDGLPGRVLGIDIRDDDSDDAGTRRGQLLVNQGDGVVQKYIWGPGATCLNSFDLTVFEEAMLADLVGQKKKLLVPKYKSGLSGTRCLTRFWIVDKKAVDLAE